MAVKQCRRNVYGHSDASWVTLLIPVMKACRAQVMVDEIVLPFNESHFNPITSISVQNSTMET